ncbi:MAG TPA: hypothetical protein VD864_00760 [Nocardioides sp.]|nr:hypothetical protein [Nocardioides sp.]
MSLLTLAAVAVSVAVLAATLATPSGSASARRRAAERRRRYVSRHPVAVNLGDVERRLAAELPPHHVDFVLARVARHRVDARTLWTWLDRFGAEALVLALAADHGYAGLLRLLRTDAAYDVDGLVGDLAVLARLSTPELFADRAGEALARN